MMDADDYDLELEAEYGASGREKAERRQRSWSQYLIVALGLAVVVLLVVVVGLSAVLLTSSASASGDSSGPRQGTPTDNSSGDSQFQYEGKVFTETFRLEEAFVVGAGKHKQKVWHHVPRPEGDVAIRQVGFRLVDYKGNKVALESVYNHHVFLVHDSLAFMAGIGAEGDRSLALDLPHPYALYSPADEHWHLSIHLVNVGGLASHADFPVFIEYTVTYSPWEEDSEFQAVTAHLVGQGAENDEQDEGDDVEDPGPPEKEAREVEESWSASFATPTETLSQAQLAHLRAVRNQVRKYAALLDGPDHPQDSRRRSLSKRDVWIDLDGSANPPEMESVNEFVWNRGSGTLVQIQAHVHIGGLRQTMLNLETGQVLADSYPVYDNAGYIVRLGRSYPLSPIENGHRIRLTAVYDNHYNYGRVMNLQLVYGTFEEEYIDLHGHTASEFNLSSTVGYVEE